MTVRSIALLLPLCLGLVGCGGGVAPIRLDGEQASATALSQWDGNGDGRLTEAELEAAPGLRSALARLDTDGDRALSPDEIRARLAAYAEQSEFVGTTVQVQSSGRPVAGVQVKMELESFLGSGLPVFEGVSDEGGMVSLASQPEGLPGLPLGFYRVTLTPGDGKPAHVVGCEVADDAPSVGRLVFSLP